MAMVEPWMPERIDGAGPILLLCDHASNAVPPGVNLGIDADLLNRHIAIDIGAAALTRALAGLLGAPAILATVSRLVIDLHREPDRADLIPLASDGHAIPGNMGADRAGRIARFHAPYHRIVSGAIDAHRPRLIVAIHSFTPALETGNAPRPWEIGILYNRDTRAARLAIDLLARDGAIVGDNQPYSGRDLNTTLNRHAEARGIPSFAVEMRNNLIGDDDGVADWVGRLAPVLTQIVSQMA